MAKAIARYAPVSLGDEVAAFARTVVADAEPKSVARAKALLYAAGRLGAFGTSVGLELDPSVMLHPSVIERFIIVRTAQMSPAMRRTLRSNLRALARDAMANAAPAPVSLSASGPRLPILWPRSVPTWPWPTPSRRWPDAGASRGSSPWGPGRG